MVVLQFLFGAGEAGGFPNLTKAMTVWLPRGERVRAQGIMWMFARWGGAFTPLLGLLCLPGPALLEADLRAVRIARRHLGSSLLSLVRDDPRQRKDLNDAEQALLAENAGNAGGHANVPWTAALRSRSVWLLWAQYFCLTYPWYFYITWLPTYLGERRHLTDVEVARFATLPLFLGGVGCLFSGWVSKYVVNWVGGARAHPQS